MPKEDENFLKTVEEAVNGMETFLMFTAMINSYKEDKHSPRKNGRLLHFD